MKIKKYIVLGIALVAVFAVAGTVSATHSWGDYHWARTSNPFTVKVVDSVTSSWNATLDTAVGDWNASSILNVAKEAGSDSWTARFNCTMPKGKVRACNYTYGNTGWLGIAQIVVNSAHHITKGRAAMNDTYFNTSPYNTSAWRQLVMGQEVGHTLGLDHQDENFTNPNLGTCMDYTNDPDGTLADPDQLSNEHPNQHDYDQLGVIYAHLDSVNTIAAVSSRSNGNNAEGNLHNPSAWGKTVRQDARGNNSLYERDLGKGEKLFTFVIWAE